MNYNVDEIKRFAARLEDQTSNTSKCIERVSGYLAQVNTILDKYGGDSSHELANQAKKLDSNWKSSYIQLRDSTLIVAGSMLGFYTSSTSNEHLTQEKLLDLQGKFAEFYKDNYDLKQQTTGNLFKLKNYNWVTTQYSSISEFVDNHDNFELKGEETLNLNSTKVDVCRIYDKSNNMYYYIDKDCSGRKLDEVVNSFNTIPNSLKNNVDQIVILNKNNPNDGYWSEIHGENFTSSASGGSAYKTSTSTSNSTGINIFLPVAQSTTSGTLAHEAGHCLDYKMNNFTADSQSSLSSWGTAMKQDNNFVSSYAEESFYSRPDLGSRNKEDFAESIEYLQKSGADAFKREFPNRAKILETLVPEYFK